MVIQIVDGVDHSKMQYERWIGTADPIYNPLITAVDTYEEFREMERSLGDYETLSWHPRDPGKELSRAIAEFNLRHVDFNNPMSRIDETMNGATNQGSLTSLSVSDPNSVLPNPLTFVPEWTSGLRMLGAFNCRPDIEFVQSLSDLEVADFRGDVFDPRCLPSNISFVSAENADVKQASALVNLKALKALRVVACRGVADVSRLPLTELQSLESLVLEGFSKAETVDFLLDMPNLRFVGLGGFSMVTDLSPVLALPNLEQLHIRDVGMRGVRSYEQLVSLLDRPDFQNLAGLWPKQLGLPDSTEVKLSQDWSGLMTWPLRHHYFR